MFPDYLSVSYDYDSILYTALAKSWSAKGASHQQVFMGA